MPFLAALLRQPSWPLSRPWHPPKVLTVWNGGAGGCWRQRSEWDQRMAVMRAWMSGGQAGLERMERAGRCWCIKHQPLTVQQPVRWEPLSGAESWASCSQSPPAYRTPSPFGCFPVSPGHVRSIPQPHSWPASQNSPLCRCSADNSVTHLPLWVLMISASRGVWQDLGEWKKKLSQM